MSRSAYSSTKSDGIVTCRTRSDRRKQVKDAAYVPDNLSQESEVDILPVKSVKQWAQEDAEEYEVDCAKTKERWGTAAKDKEYYERIKKDEAKYRAYKTRKATEKRQQRLKKKAALEARDARLKELSNNIKANTAQMKVSFDERKRATKAREKVEAQLEEALKEKAELKAKYKAMERMLRTMIFSHEQVVAWKASGRGQKALKGCTLPFPQLGSLEVESLIKEDLGFRFYQAFQKFHREE